MTHARADSEYAPSAPEAVAPHTPAGALDTLRPMAAVAAAIMLGFLIYNLVEFPPGVRETMAVHDIVSAAVCAGVWWLIRSGRLREEQAHAAATGLILLIASNILLAMWLLRAPYHAVYICVLLVGAGAGMSSIGWAAVSTALLWALTVPVLVAASDWAITLRYVAMMGATSAVALSLVAIRVRNLRVVTRLTELDQQQRRALNDALADLDAKVLQRTEELRAANAALQTQMDERARAEHEARLLGEQLLHAQRLESLGRLAGGVAHDFNNLLTVIDGNLSLVLEDLPPGASREPVEDALSASERAGHLTRELLAFGRKQVMERTVFDVGQRIEDIARMLQRVLGERVALHVRTDERDLWVSADPNQIEQILMNLTVNARDAMPDGGECFIDVARAVVGNAPFIRIRVRDTGMGMDAATKERIFEPFFTTKGAGAGTGLGLSTAYGVVQQHGGSISVESSPGAGATFDVLLPAAEDAALAADGAASAGASTSGTETVLLVEDEEGVRRVAERFLRHQGYDVHVASSGFEALEIAARLGRPIDLLFTDVMMPAMSGRELAERLRLAQPDLKVLFVSGYTGDYLQTQTGELPAGTHLLYKPYELGRTARLIRGILEGQPVPER